MGTSANPLVIDALVERATAALPDALVVDGWAVTDSPAPLLLSIGLADTDEAQTGTLSASSQTMAVAGTDRARDQEGTVTCLALAWNGDGDQKVARDAAYGLVAAVEDLLRDDPTLGVAAPGRSVCQLADEALTQRQHADGVDALVIFTVHFRVRI